MITTLILMLTHSVSTFALINCDYIDDLLGALSYWFRHL